MILYPPRSVANIFGNWLTGVDPKVKLFIRVGAIAVIWSLWLCRNDKNFNDKISSLMQVIIRCTATLRSWSPLQRVEHRGLFVEVSSRLEAAAWGFFSHGWQHNLRITHPALYADLQFLTMICNSSFLLFVLNWLLLNWWLCAS